MEKMYSERPIPRRFQLSNGPFKLKTDFDNWTPFDNRMWITKKAIWYWTASLDHFIQKNICFMTLFYVYNGLAYQTIKKTDKYVWFSNGLKTTTI
jgi:hypothetical protein